MLYFWIGILRLKIDEDYDMSWLTQVPSLEGSVVTFDIEKDYFDEYYFGLQSGVVSLEENQRVDRCCMTIYWWKTFCHMWRLINVSLLLLRCISVINFIVLRCRL